MIGVKMATGTSHQGSLYLQPGHVITLMPAVRVVNLLPIELTYYLNNTDIKGSIKPGQTAPILAVCNNFFSYLIVVHYLYCLPTFSS